MHFFFCISDETSSVSPIATNETEEVVALSQNSLSHPPPSPQMIQQNSEKEILSSVTKTVKKKKRKLNETVVKKNEGIFNFLLLKCKRFKR